MKNVIRTGDAPCACSWRAFDRTLALVSSSQTADSRSGLTKELQWTARRVVALGRNYTRRPGWCRAQRWTQTVGLIGGATGFYGLSPGRGEPPSPGQGLEGRPGGQSGRGPALCRRRALTRAYSLIPCACSPLACVRVRAYVRCRAGERGRRRGKWPVSPNAAAAWFVKGQVVCAPFPNGARAGFFFGGWLLQVRFEVLVEIAFSLISRFRFIEAGYIFK